MGALRDFVSDVLEIEGSAVEAVEPDGLEVLAPEPLRTAMGWPELVRLGFGAELPAGAMAVGFEGDWLDRFGALLGDRGRLGRATVRAPKPVPRPARSRTPARPRPRSSQCHLALAWRLGGLGALPAAGVPLHRCLRREARRAGLARIQPGNRRGHRRRFSAVASAAGGGHGMASTRPGRPPRGGTGVGCAHS